MHTWMVYQARPWHLEPRLALEEVNPCWVTINGSLIFKQSNLKDTSPGKIERQFKLHLYILAVNKNNNLLLIWISWPSPHGLASLKFHKISWYTGRMLPKCEELPRWSQLHLEIVTMQKIERENGKCLLCEMTTYREGWWDGRRAGRPTRQSASSARKGSTISGWRWPQWGKGLLHVFKDHNFPFRNYHFDSIDLPRSCWCTATLHLGSLQPEAQTGDDKNCQTFVVVFF